MSDFNENDIEGQWVEPKTNGSNRWVWSDAEKKFVDQSDNPWAFWGAFLLFSVGISMIVILIKVL